MNMFIYIYIYKQHIKTGVRAIQMVCKQFLYLSLYAACNQRIIIYGPIIIYDVQHVWFGVGVILFIVFACFIYFTVG